MYISRWSASMGFHRFAMLMIGVIISAAWFSLGGAAAVESSPPSDEACGSQCVHGQWECQRPCTYARPAWAMDFTYFHEVDDHRVSDLSSCTEFIPWNASTMQVDVDLYCVFPDLQSCRDPWCQDPFLGCDNMHQFWFTGLAMLDGCSPAATDPHAADLLHETCRWTCKHRRPFARCTMQFDPTGRFFPRKHLEACWVEENCDTSLWRTTEVRSVCKADPHVAASILDSTPSGQLLRSRTNITGAIALSVAHTPTSQADAPALQLLPSEMQVTKAVRQALALLVDGIPVESVSVKAATSLESVAQELHSKHARRLERMSNRTAINITYQVVTDEADAAVVQAELDAITKQELGSSIAAQLQAGSSGMISSDVFEVEVDDMFNVSLPLADLTDAQALQAQLEQALARQKELQELLNEATTSDSADDAKLQEALAANAVLQEQLQEKSADHGQQLGELAQAMEEQATAFGTERAAFERRQQVLTSRLAEALADLNETEKDMSQMAAAHNLTKQQMQAANVAHQAAQLQLQALAGVAASLESQLAAALGEHAQAVAELSELRSVENATRAELQTTRSVLNSTKAALQAATAASALSRLRSDDAAARYNRTLEELATVNASHRAALSNLRKAEALHAALADDLAAAQQGSAARQREDLHALEESHHAALAEREKAHEEYDKVETQLNDTVQEQRAVHAELAAANVSYSTALEELSAAESAHRSADTRAVAAAEEHLETQLAMTTALSKEEDAKKAMVVAQTAQVQLGDNLARAMLALSTIREELWASVNAHNATREELRYARLNLVEAMADHKAALHALKKEKAQLVAAQERLKHEQLGHEDAQKQLDVERLIFGSALVALAVLGASLAGRILWLKRVQRQLGRNENVELQAFTAAVRSAGGGVLGSPLDAHSQLDVGVSPYVVGRPVAAGVAQQCPEDAKDAQGCPTVGGKCKQAQQEERGDPAAGKGDPEQGDLKASTYRIEHGGKNTAAQPVPQQEEQEQQLSAKGDMMLKGLPTPPPQPPQQDEVVLEVQDQVVVDVAPGHFHSLPVVAGELSSAVLTTWPGVAATSTERVSQRQLPDPLGGRQKDKARRKKAAATTAKEEDVVEEDAKANCQKPASRAPLAKEALQNEAANQKKANAVQCEAEVDTAYELVAAVGKSSAELEESLASSLKAKKETVDEKVEPVLREAKKVAEAEEKDVAQQIPQSSAAASEETPAAASAVKQQQDRDAPLPARREPRFTSLPSIHALKSGLHLQLADDEDPTTAGEEDAAGSPVLVMSSSQGMKSSKGDSKGRCDASSRAAASEEAKLPLLRCLPELPTSPPSLEKALEKSPCQVRQAAWSEIKVPDAVDCTAGSPESMAGEVKGGTTVCIRSESSGSSVS
eukprot:TRINITY_DN11026_c0_g1_i1.p1 TRINITY_DN11026_c0_g1~~TRINITY_DN11026_c0_g1_i1.p1  ORF type:complete len:1382 (+),score=370.85 TRINITY_DN11026_c0_g1_i1:145-4290(+)